MVGDNLIMLDKRSDGSGHNQPASHDNIEPISGADVPPISESSEDLPF